MYFLEQFTPPSYLIQNNHIVKRSIIASLKDEYFIFDKYNFYKQLWAKTDKNPESPLAEEDFQKIFLGNIRNITDKNSCNIFSSRLINNAFEHERFPIKVRNPEDIEFLRVFHERTKDCEPAQSYLEEVVNRTSRLWSDVEDRIEKMFLAQRELPHNLTEDDLVDFYYYSKMQICRSKKTLLSLCDEIIKSNNLSLVNPTPEDINFIRDEVFKKQLNIKNKGIIQGSNLFSYRYSTQIFSKKPLWLGDCDVLSSKEKILKRTCDCGECKTEDESNCSWYNREFETYSNATCFLSPNFLISLHCENKVDRNFILQTWNQKSLSEAIFHILIDKDSINELYVTTIELLSSELFYLHPIDQIDNLSKVEIFLKNQKNTIKQSVIDESKEKILMAISDVKEKGIPVYFKCSFDETIQFDALFRKNNIKIYENIPSGKQSELYVVKSFSIFERAYRYDLYKPK